MDDQIKIGLAPMRRNTTNRPAKTFLTWVSAEERGHRFVKYIEEHFASGNVSFVNINGIGCNDLMYDDESAQAVIERFRKEKVDAVIIINCNFGNEEIAADVAKALGKPVALWAPLDDEYYEDGMRPTDSQCGLFALSLDAATHTAVLLDEDRQVIRPAILWTDQRSKEQVQWLKDNCLDVIMEQALNAPTTVWTLPQLMWLRDNEPQTWSKIRYVLFAKDYLRFRLTGTLETDTIDAAGSMFFDVRKECWSEELCRIGGIDLSWLPRLCRPTDLAGCVTGQCAREFGLAEGT